MSKFENKKTVGLGVLTALIAFAIAPAANSSTISLTSGNGVVEDGTLSLQGDGRTINVSGATFTDTETGPLNITRLGSTLVQSDAGLEVIQIGDNAGQGLGAFGGPDVLIFNIDEAVTIESLTFTGVDLNDDFDIFLDTNNDGVLERVAFDVFINEASGTPAGTSVATVALASLMEISGTFFGIGADGFDDNFFLSAIQLADVGVSEVPIPGALPLFATAMAGFSLSRRKKKKLQTI